MIVSFAGEEAGVAGRPDQAGGGHHIRHHGGPQRQPREHLRVLRLQGRDAEGNASHLLTVFLVGMDSLLICFLLLICRVQSEMLQEANISKFKSQVQSSQVCLEPNCLFDVNLMTTDVCRSCCSYGCWLPFC